MVCSRCGHAENTTRKPKYPTTSNRMLVNPPLADPAVKVAGHTVARRLVFITRGIE